jgi:hypothetical protein
LSFLTKIKLSVHLSTHMKKQKVTDEIYDETPVLEKD